MISTSAKLSIGAWSLTLCLGSVNSPLHTLFFATTALLFAAFTMRIVSYSQQHAFLLGGATACWLLLNALWSISPGPVATQPIHDTYMFAFWLVFPAIMLAGVIDSRESVSTFALWISSLSLCIALAGIIFGRSVFDDNRYQTAGNLCAIGFSLSLVGYYAGSRSLKIHFVVCLVVLFLGACVFASRQGLVALVVNYILLTIFGRFSDTRKSLLATRPVAVLAAPFVVIVFILLAFPSIAELPISRFYDIFYNDATSGRTTLASEALDIGPGGIFGRGTSFLAGRHFAIPGHYPHNILIEAYVEHGLVGILFGTLIICFFISSAASALRYFHPARNIVLIVPGLALMSFVSGDIPTARYLWPFIFFVIALPMTIHTHTFMLRNLNARQPKPLHNV